MPRIYPVLFVSFVVLCFVFLSCEPEIEPRFERIDSEYSGINFENRLTPTPELNIFNYLYFYDGAGVAVGDLNGDGLPDIYFGSNQGVNKLYMNEGDFEFRDITDEAFESVLNAWTTGVTFVDINNDGRLDIYISNVGGFLSFEGRNQLFINLGNNEQGIPQFVENADKYGLEFQGLATQAAFFDYDRDGDLDMYMMNHSVHSFGTFTDASFREESHEIAGDRLLRNDNGRFTDVTEEAVIYNSALGYGLGIGISDFNGDGYPDIYIGNDFHEDDYLYLNNGDGTFTESLGEMIQHTSYSSMGNDLIDINNDGLIDIISLDMLPEDYEQLKASAAEDPLEIYNTKLSYGYKHKFTRNTLQLNRGGNKFSEIGMLSGIYATDWSWASLGADFDHDRYTDLYITNGIYGRTNNLDYITYITQDEIQQRLEGNLSEEEVKLAERAPSVKVPNYAYKNSGSLVFDDVSTEWGLDSPAYSSGAVYADLDNDGDLDLVVNNTNGKAFIYKNTTRERFSESNYLKIKFEGPPKNRFGVGSKVTIPLPENDEIMVREMYTVRGFQSSVEPILHFGLDSLAVVPELRIYWPDGQIQLLHDVPANQTLTIDYTEAVSLEENESNEEHTPPILSRMTDLSGIDYKHEENEFVEFNREPLIPHMVSREGPAFVSGDINSDGLDDFFVGGAKRQAGELYIQESDGTFQKKNTPAFQEDYIQEDVDAKFTDFTGNGHVDLLVVSGGNEYSGNSEFMPPRLYINDGKGNFSRDPNRLPDLFISGSVAEISDINNDGAPDIFIGARAVPWNYGKRPESYLLLNNGEGYFEIDNSTFGKRFSDLGMVTDAQWADMDGDDRPDLVVASEWEELRIIYHNESKGIEKISESSGLWNTLAISDLNGDGKLDIAGGNLGLNSKFNASPDHPLRMYINDFDENGMIEQVVTYTDRTGEERVFATRDELVEQFPGFDKKFPTYQSFAEADLYDLFDKSMLEDALVYVVDELQSSVFYNTEDEDGFSKKTLPLTAQFSTLNTILPVDLNNDYNVDLLAAGNSLHPNIQRGRYDSGYGNILVNKGNGLLEEMSNRKADWFLEGQIQKLDTLRIGETKVLVVVENDHPLRFYEFNLNEQEF